MALRSVVWTTALALGGISLIWSMARRQRRLPAPALARAPGRLAPPRRGQPVREAGPEAMRDPPRRWESVDEQGDETFPASDPPGNY